MVERLFGGVPRAVPVTPVIFKGASPRTSQDLFTIRPCQSMSKVVQDYVEEHNRGLVN